MREEEEDTGAVKRNGWVRGVREGSGEVRKTVTRLVPLRGLMLVVVVVSRLSDGKCLLSYI